MKLIFNSLLFNIHYYSIIYLFIYYTITNILSSFSHTLIHGWMTERRSIINLLYIHLKYYRSSSRNNALSNRIKRNAQLKGNTIIARWFCNIEHVFFLFNNVIHARPVLLKFDQSVDFMNT